jgi:hypothetical protein
VLQQEVSGEHLESIGVAAETLATEASQIQLRGEAQTSLAFAGAILQNIKEASRDERGLETIPTYKSILGEQIGQLLEAVSATYELPPNQAVCAAYDG